MLDQLLDYPDAYTTKEVEFYGLKFFVSPAVLIPRLETEGLVRRAIHELQQNTYTQILDIGTGSGCIICAVASATTKSMRYIASDISTEALTVAHRNAQHLIGEGVIECIQSDLLKHIPAFTASTGTLILSNPPYVGWRETSLMSSDTQYEPQNALFGGENGFELWEQLLSEIIERFETGGLGNHTTIIGEMGHAHVPILKEVCTRLGIHSCELFRDFSSIERFFIVKIGNE